MLLHAAALSITLSIISFRAIWRASDTCKELNIPTVLAPNALLHMIKHDTYHRSSLAPNHCGLLWSMSSQIVHNLSFSYSSLLLFAIAFVEKEYFCF